MLMLLDFGAAVQTSGFVAVVVAAVVAAAAVAVAVAVAVVSLVVVGEKLRWSRFASALG